MSWLVVVVNEVLDLAELVLAIVGDGGDSKSVQPFVCQIGIYNNGN